VTVAFISHSDCGRHDTGWGAPEHVGRLRAITSAMKYDMELFMSLNHMEGRHATHEEIALAHDPEYIRLVEELAKSGGGRFDADTVASEGSWDAATAAVGCVLDGVDLAFGPAPMRSFSAVRPPGHHALRDAAMGFCLFGNVAIAAHYALKKHGAERVLIVDWDVHHGNGTQALVEQTPGIHFVSMHQWPWYPGSGAESERGVGNVWNIPMGAGLAAQTYVDALERGIDAATKGFTPDLVLISAGFDSLGGDPLGGFTLTPQDLAGVGRRLVQRAEGWCKGRVVSSLEGGYSLGLLGQGVLAHLQSLQEQTN
jgi:acetoin utilization deacetylase AcuC-like enzyme